ncbi:MAG: GNAT family N-acetyltransferase [Lachnospiraceae bacterium]|nr:GNAT family N-acetyltransferase [Lachnospiraceae bacterium]
MDFKPLDEDYRLEGDRVYLRPITGEDTQMVLSWRNSEFVMSHFFYRKQISVSEHEKWLAEKVAQGLVYQFILCMKDGDIPVGSVYLQHYDMTDNSMEAGLFMDEKSPGGRGVATEGYELMTDDFAKNVLGLSKLFARIIADNRGSIRVHEKCGFKQKEVTEEKVFPTGETEVALLMEKIL